jgi:hypothetical protein
LKIEEKNLKKKHYLRPKRPLSSFGLDVVGLRQLVALVDVGVGVGVVTAGGDGVVVVVGVRERPPSSSMARDLASERSLKERQK